MLTGCTSAPPTGQVTTGAVVIGSEDTVVSSVLARIYAGSLRRTGIEVSVAPPFASRSDVVNALDRVAVTFVPDFSGDLLAELDPDSTATTSDEVFEALNRSLPEWLSVSDAAGAENRESVFVSEDDAATLAGATLTDLAPVCDRSTVAVSGDADAVLLPLRATYGCAFAAVRSVDPDGARELLRRNEVQAAVVSATDVGADDSGTRDVTLADTENAYRAQNVVPLFRKNSLGDAQTTALGVVAGDLTTADLADMVARVRDGDSPDAVAEEWLGERGY
ncbi:glycine betaine ABC transporter substrate-binding protein [Actinomycetes bacterium M1A6_2h]